jgi:phosphate transport system permease protein
LQFITPTVLKGWFGIDVDFTNALSAGIVLGVMIIPTIASLSEDAMSAVPQALRQGSFAMGANRMQTTLRVVFPAAVSGIAAAIVLGISRGVGETMIVALAAGSQPNLSLDVREGMQTMTGYIANTAGGENIVGSVSYNTLFAVGLLLFVLTLFINMISIALVRRIREAY